MPTITKLFDKIDPITADLAYVRWLGDRKAIEEQTKAWDKVVVDRTQDLRNWVEVLRGLVTDKRIRKILAFMNNHYQDTLRQRSNCSSICGPKRIRI